MLAGIYLPSGGELLFDGHVVNEVEARDRNVGIVFQSYALYPHMTVRDNILLPASLQEDAARGSARPRQGGGRSRPCRRAAGPPAERAFGRPAAARGARARPGEGAAAPAPRRAALQPRRDAAPDHAHRDQVAAGEARRDDGPGHPRPDRGDDDGRPHHLHARRPDRAGRHAGRPLSPAEEPVHRELHRLAADQPDQGRGRATAPCARVPSTFPFDGTARAASPSGCGRSTCGSQPPGSPAASPRPSPWGARSSMSWRPPSAMCACSSTAPRRRTRRASP